MVYHSIVFLTIELFLLEHIYQMLMLEAIKPLAEVRLDIFQWYFLYWFHHTGLSFLQILLTILKSHIHHSLLNLHDIFLLKNYFLQFFVYIFLLVLTIMIFNYLHHRLHLLLIFLLLLLIPIIPCLDVL